METREQTIARLDREWWQESALLNKHFGADLRVLLKLAYDAGRASQVDKDSERLGHEQAYREHYGNGG